MDLGADPSVCLETVAGSARCVRKLTEKIHRSESRWVLLLPLNAAEANAEISDRLPFLPTGKDVGIQCRTNTLFLEKNDDLVREFVRRFFCRREYQFG